MLVAFSGMNGRDRILQVLLLLHGLVATVSAIALALSIGRVGELRHTTSGKILAAALLALGFGAFTAARAPRRHRTIVQMLIVFGSLSALAVVYRLATEHHYHDLAWLVLPLVLAAPVLLLVFYPYGRDDQEETARIEGDKRERPA
jgi:peptidoglycan/LPS O-acetylase OafA/YrhL